MGRDAAHRPGIPAPWSRLLRHSERAVLRAALYPARDRGHARRIRLTNVQSATSRATSRSPSQDVQNDKATIDNLRLWDFSPHGTYEQLQTIRTYYSFHDIDIDRYTISTPVQSSWRSALASSTRPRSPRPPRTGSTIHPQYTTATASPPARSTRSSARVSRTTCQATSLRRNTEGHTARHLLRRADR